MNKEKNQIKTGIFLNYINLILGNIIPIFYTPIMLKLLGKNEYGLYKLSANITSYLSLISLGISSAVVRYLIQARVEKGKKGEEEVFGLFMVIFQFIAVTSFIVGMILTVNLKIWYGNSLTITEIERMKILVFLLVCNTALSFSMTPYVSLVNAHEKFVFLQCMNIILTCLGPIVNLIMLFMGFASIGMAVSTLVLGIIVRVIYFLFVKKSMKLKPRYVKGSMDLLKNILSFSFWVFVANVVGQLYNATDTVMIGLVPELGAEGVAVYNIGLTFNSIMFGLTTGISNLLSPKINKMVFQGASGEELTDLAIKVGRIQSYIMSLVISGFIAFGQPFIYFYAGKEFSESYWVAVLMMIPNMIPLAQSVCLSIIVAQNKHQFRSIMYLGIAILNVIGTWYLMHSMGIIGATLMTGLALFLGQGIAMNWYYDRKSGINIIRFWKEVGEIFVIPTILCIVTLVISKRVDFYHPMILIMGICIYVLIYISAIWRLEFNSYERRLVITQIRRLMRK